MAMLCATTTYGAVRGIPSKNGKCTTFLGIPFAKPPVGELRFSRPTEPDSWEGERLCDKFAPACIQRLHPDESFEISEDCLYLNVFTPAESRDESLPVLFWIYGGGFSGGRTSDPEFYGEQLCEEGAVLVTISYRCGPLGFFNLPELEKKGFGGNLGLMDQVAALKWVQENIAQFGGDPTRVLVHGQSAGGMSTRMQLTDPMAQGLFSRAVIQSGGGFNEADLVRPYDEFTGICASSLEHIGCTLDDAMKMDAAEFTQKISDAAREICGPGEIGYFQPFIDGMTLTDVPGKLVARGEYMDIPIICGTVAGDSFMFCRKVRDSLNDNDEYFRGFSYVASQAWAANQVKTGRTPIYTYYMDREQNLKREMRMNHGKPPYGSKTPHCSEISYVFGTLGERQKSVEELDVQMSKAMSKYWVNFARTGDPNGEGLPTWHKYTAEEPFAMHFGNDDFKAENIVLSDNERKVIEYTEAHPGMLTEVEGF